MKKPSLFTLAALCSVLAPGAAWATTISINFDVNAAGNPLSAPALFDSASPLKNAYSSLGVHFAGPSSNKGGAILNDSTFTSKALSGSNFLAFTPVEAQFVGPETIIFDTAMSYVSIFACSLSHPMDATIAAYDQFGTLLDTETIALAGKGYSQLSVNGSADIKSVVLTVTNNGYYGYVYDNLFATSSRVPETAPSLALLLIGVGATAGLRRRLAPAAR